MANDPIYPADEQIQQLLRATGETLTRKTEADHVYKQLLKFFEVGVPTGSPENLLNDVNSLLNGSFDIIEKSFKESNKDLKAYLEGAEDLSTVQRTWLNMRVAASGAFTDELVAAMRDKFRIQDFACCMINSLTRIEQQESVSVHDNLLSKKRSLKVIRTALLLSRNILQRGILSGTLEFSFNFMKMMMEELHTLWLGMYSVLIEHLQYTLIYKVSRWMIDRRIGLECFGFVRLWQFLMNQLASTFLPKLRSILYSAFLQLSGESYQSQTEIVRFRNLMTIDFIIKLIDTLTEAIDIEIVCRPGRSDYEQIQDATRQAIDITTEEGAGKPEPAPGEADPGNTYLGGVRSTPVNVDDKTYSPTSKVSVDATRLFFDPTQEELERFLVKFLNVPQEEAQRAAEASATGNCFEKLSESETQQVQAALQQLRI